MSVQRSHTTSGGVAQGSIKHHTAASTTKTSATMDYRALGSQLLHTSTRAIKVICLSGLPRGPTSNTRERTAHSGRHGNSIATHCQRGYDVDDAATLGFRVSGANVLHICDTSEGISCSVTRAFVWCAFISFGVVCWCVFSLLGVFSFHFVPFVSSFGVLSFRVKRFR